eukprot:scaffold42929_cov69-Phaeocystis_antarctica.AAC.12
MISRLGTQGLGHRGWKKSWRRYAGPSSRAGACRGLGVGTGLRLGGKGCKGLYGRLGEAKD